MRVEILWLTEVMRIYRIAFDILPHVFASLRTTLQNVFQRIIARSHLSFLLDARINFSLATSPYSLDWGLATLNVDPLIATKIRGTPEIADEVLRIPFRNFLFAAAVMRNPWLNRFSSALRVHLRYVSSHVRAALNSIDRIHYEWLKLRAYQIWELVRGHWLENPVHWLVRAHSSVILSLVYVCANYAGCPNSVDPWFIFRNRAGGMHLTILSRMCNF